MAFNQYTDSAITDIGTQLFVLEGTTMNYAFPVQAGGVFGGDTESYDAPDTDLNYIPKVSGRTSLNDVEYTINYSNERYARVQTFTDSKDHIYAEIFNDGSGVVFKGTSGRPTINNDNPKTITHSVAPSFMQWVQNINALSEDEAGEITSVDKSLVTGAGKDGDPFKLNVNPNSVPATRAKYVVKPATAQS